MKAQQEQLGEMLVREGWRIIDRSASSDWWLDEVWTVESSWSPVGGLGYVSFLVDPQAPPERPKGEHVWAVSIGREVALSATPPGAVPLRPNWESARCAEAQEHIRRLRS